MNCSISHYIVGLCICITPPLWIPAGFILHNKLRTDCNNIVDSIRANDLIKLQYVDIEVLFISANRQLFTVAAAFISHGLGYRHCKPYMISAKNMYNAVYDVLFDDVIRDFMPQKNHLKSEYLTVLDQKRTLEMIAERHQCLLMRVHLLRFKYAAITIQRAFKKYRIRSVTSILCRTTLSRDVINIIIHKLFKE